MTNETGIIVGRLSRNELAAIVRFSSDAEIRNKFMGLLMYMKDDQEDLVISEYLA